MLHFAISSGQKGLVKELLARGADRTLEMYSLRTGFDKRTPQELVSILGHNSIAVLLASWLGQTADGCRGVMRHIALVIASRPRNKSGNRRITVTADHEAR